MISRRRHEECLCGSRIKILHESGRARLSQFSRR
jgi:hypothetical protein